MTLFQFTAVLFAIFMAYVVRVHQQRSRLSRLEASFWYSLWFLFGVLAIFPDLLLGISDYFYFDRVFDLLVVGALMVLSFLVVRSYFKYREIQLQLEKLVQEQALLEAKREQALRVYGRRGLTSSRKKSKK